jgi:hypothetical protein
MGFWGSLANKLLPGQPFGAPSRAQATPPYVPPGDVSAGGPPAPAPGTVDWQRLIEILAPAGVNFAGRAIEAGSQNAQAEALRERTKMLDDQAREEMRRRDFYANVLLPNLLRGSGFNPAEIAQKMNTGPLVR